MYLGLVGLCVDVSQLLVNGHGLTELLCPLKYFLQALLCAVHVLQVQQGHPHIQLLLLLPGTTQDTFYKKYNQLMVKKNVSTSIKYAISIDMDTYVLTNKHLIQSVT